MKKTIVMTFILILIQGMALKGCSTDTDWDGLTDDQDNCTETYNPVQDDEDQDKMGDACDNDTPWHDLTFTGCYLSDWPPLRGVNWEDRPTWIEQGDVKNTQVYAAIDWTASDSDWIESGEGTTNGLWIWFDISDEHNPYLFTRTLTEGKGEDTNGDGKVDEIHGTYVMLNCDSEAGDCDFDSNPYEYFTDGEWNATRVNSLECNHIN